MNARIASSFAFSVAILLNSDARGQAPGGAASVAAPASESAAKKMEPGNLIKYGVTGGLALTLQITTGRGIENRSLYGASAAVLPYVMLHPGYLRNAKYDAKRAYCAERWQGSGFKDASEAALRDAQEKAVRTYKAVLQIIARSRGTQPLNCKEDQQSDRAPGPLAPDFNICERYNISEADLDVLKDIYREFYSQGAAPPPGGAGEVRATAAEPLAPRERDMLYSLTYRYWNPSLAPNCGQYNVGIWVGLGGLPYTAQVSTYSGEGDSRASRTIVPVAAGGIGYSPNTYFSILAGVTYSLIQEGRADGGTDSYHLVTPMLGVAGSLSIFTDLGKK